MARAHIYIIACGGTIAGKAASEREMIGYTAGEFTIEELLQSIPALQDYAYVTGEQFCNIDSSDMTEALWLRLAERVADVAAQNDVDGIVITHGTDTMEETAYFLDLVIHSRKPVIMVGAMRPATAVSADGPLNLLDAVRLAACPEAGQYGVLIAMNGRICEARSAEKTDTAHVDAFQSRQLGYVGMIQNGIPYFYQQSLRRHTYASELSCQGVSALPAVWIVYCHVGISPSAVQAAVDAGACGIVFAGLGHGNIPDSMSDVLKEARKKHVVLVRTSRTLGGIVCHRTDDAGTAVIAGDTLPCHKAKILLQLALLQTDDAVKIQKIFDRY